MGGRGAEWWGLTAVVVKKKSQDFSELPSGHGMFCSGRVTNCYPGKIGMYYDGRAVGTCEH